MTQPAASRISGLAIAGGPRGAESGGLYRRGEMIFANWQVSMPTTPGVYRVDVTLDGTALWRGFFRVTD